MSWPAAAIRTAIAECLEGSIGSTFTLDTDVFARGVFAGQPEATVRALAIQTSTARCRFDVEVGELRDHGANGLSVRHARRIAECDVTISVVAKLATPAQADQRDTDIDEIVSAMDDAVLALTYRDNLAATSAAVSTNMVAGALFGPGESTTPEIVVDAEDWDAQLYRARIVARAIVLPSRVAGSA